MESLEQNKSSKTLNLRKKRFFLCKDHHALPQQWKQDIHGNCSKCLNYDLADHLPNGILPTGHELLEYILTLGSSNTGKHSNISLLAAKDLVLHWIFCNVYPTNTRTVVVIAFISLGRFKKKSINIDYDIMKIRRNAHKRKEK